VRVKERAPRTEPGLRLGAAAGRQGIAAARQLREQRTIGRWRGHGAMALGPARIQAAAMWCRGGRRSEVPGGGAQGTLAASMGASGRWLLWARTGS
jgi:hypothetical protein